MALNPDEIERMRFSIARRGYDSSEVDTFLAWLANELRTDDDFDRAGTEVATALRRMHRSVLDIQSAAEEEAAAIREAAERYATETRGEADRERHELLEELAAAAARAHAEAESERDAITKAAREHLTDAQRILVEAEAESQRLRSDADAYLESVNVLAERSARERAAAALHEMRDDLARLVYERETVRANLRQLRIAIANAIEPADESELDLTAEEPPKPVEVKTDQPDPIDALVDQTVAEAVKRSPRQLRPF
jgi:DivIVA domain-containing protein